MNSQIVEYVKNQLKAGYSLKEIKQALVEQGWSNSEIETAIVYAQEPSSHISPEMEKMSKMGFEKHPESLKGPQGPGPEIKKHTMGFIISLLAGLFIIHEIIKMGFSETLTSALSSVFIMFEMTLGSMLMGILGIVFGIIVLVGCFFIYKSKNRIGGIIVIVFSVLIFIFTSSIIILLLGIIGGIFALKRK